MNLIFEAIAWIFTPSAWPNSQPVPLALWQHVEFTLMAVVIAAIIAIPAGWAIGHTGKGREIAVALTGAARAIPSFGLVVLLVMVVGISGETEITIFALVLLAIPPILAGAYAGIEAIDRSVVGAGRAMGMTGAQVLWRIEIPLGLPLLIAGLRSATLQVVSTVTIAAFIGLGSLGYFILQGIQTRNIQEILAGSLLVVFLALAFDGLLAIFQRLVVPRGVRARHAPTRREPLRRTRTKAEVPA